MVKASILLNQIAQIFSNQPSIKNLYMKDSVTASRAFGFKNAMLTTSPRSKFLFYINFLRPGGIGGGPKLYGNWATGVSLLAKTVTRPNITFATETLNQYNKKRVVQSKLDYEPIDLEFYDTNDQRVMAMFKDYLKYYYGDFHARSKIDWLADQTAETFHFPNTNKDWGFNAPYGNPSDSYFFETLEVWQFAAGRFDKYSLVHPIISSFNYDTYDYGSSEPQLIQLKINYEGIIFEAQNQPLDLSLVDQAALNIGEYYNPQYPIIPPLPYATQTEANAYDVLNKVIKVTTGSTILEPLANAAMNNPSFTSSLGNQVNPGFYSNTSSGYNANASVDQISLGIDRVGALSNSYTASPGETINNTGRMVGNSVINRLLKGFTG